MWYSDIWDDLKGTKQTIDEKELKRRSAAYPFLLPYRLINMYSVFGDTILDPFLGTGTTAFAAMACGRNSIGYEQDPAFAQSIRNKAGEDILSLSNNSVQRINKHLFYINNFKKGITSFNYINDYFGFPVMTRQETKMKLKFIESVRKIDYHLFRTDYLDDQDVLNMGLGKQFIDNIS
ncbi:MAG: DNA methyltransferase [Bacillota bacterium]|nr:DNA methyltransferase [Bacillota bacterium]